MCSQYHFKAFLQGFSLRRKLTQTYKYFINAWSPRHDFDIDLFVTQNSLNLYVVIIFQVDMFSYAETSSNNEAMVFF